MRIRIGVDYRDLPAHIDTASASRIALIGAGGAGKTTTCRYLLRRWLHQRTHTATVLTPRPHEYRDLPVTASTTAALVSDLAAPPTDQVWPELVVIDDADLLERAGVAAALVHARGLVVLTSAGAQSTDLLCTETIPIESIYDVHYAHRRYPAPVQMRFDLPATAIAVRLDPRLPQDFPHHRWAS